MKMQQWFGVFLCVWFGTVLGVCAPEGTVEIVSPTDPTVVRARREVRLLDDIYKTAIVLITKHYVQDESDLAAGEAFKVLFQAVEKNGWHQVRLLDATGTPINEENLPRDDFERQAIQAIRANKVGYDQVETRDGKRYLRAATPIPMVMEKCTMCHEQYQAITHAVGALSYTLPLEPHQ
ncbi:MAG: DUF3365 domain-containing protein [Planctomycetota bacterium]